MPLTRRQFLLSIPGAAAGYLLSKLFPDAYAASGTIQDVEQDILFALDQGDGQYELNLGDPYEEPPEKTWRQYIEEEFGDYQTFIEWNGYYPDEFTDDLDSPADIDLYLDTWARTDSPNARAYDLLSALDLGHDLEAALRFIDGAAPGNDYLGVLAPNVHVLGLLQKRLNDLNEGLKIAIYREGAA